jgi:hypothetical protein
VLAVSFELPKISTPQTSEALRKRVLAQLALIAATNGKPSSNGAPKEGRPA